MNEYWVLAFVITPAIAVILAGSAARCSHAANK